MGRRRGTVLHVLLALLGIFIVGVCARGRESELQLRQRIQNEQNPVKKAKIEIKLANLQLADAQSAYLQGQIGPGAKRLAIFVDTMRASWKLLQNSGRRASKQPDGFRELEISLRENVRTLHDLEQAVSYFDRAPLTNAAQEMDQMRNEVLRALFPEQPPDRKGSSSSKTATRPGPAAGVR